MSYRNFSTLFDRTWNVFLSSTEKGPRSCDCLKVKIMKKNDSTWLCWISFFERNYVIIRRCLISSFKTLNFCFSATLSITKTRWILSNISPFFHSNSSYFCAVLAFCWSVIRLLWNIPGVNRCISNILHKSINTPSFFPHFFHGIFEPNNLGYLRCRIFLYKQTKDTCFAHTAV